MKRTLLEETKLSETLSLSVEMEEGRITLKLGSDANPLEYTFEFDEWENFVEGVKRANASMGADED